MDEEPIKELPKRPITANDLFMLVKTLREYKQLLPKKEENIMERYKANVAEDIANKLLAKGIEWFINHYLEKTFALLAKQRAKEHLENLERL